MVVLILAGLSLIVVASISPNLFWPQLLFFLAGLVLFFIHFKLDFEIYSALSVPILAIATTSLIATFILGLETRGSIRWINLFGINLQFSELAKPYIFSALASLVYHRGLKYLVLIFIPAFLILQQPDLGTTVVYLAGAGFMGFLGGVSLPILILGVMGISAAMPAIFYFLKDYQRQRILSFIYPSSDPLGSSYNAIQALIAVGSGMIFGKGVGHGTQSQLAFLPEKHTDFIFASFAEEFGLVGIILMLACYTVLFWRLIKILRRVQFGPEFLFIGASMGILFAQVFINIGMNLGILPITGITLPLVSYWGSSILSTLVVLGIVENVQSKV